MKSFNVFNITDHLDNHTIRKIIFNHFRCAILTSTKLYYLNYGNNGFKLIDVTENIAPRVNISDIKFITVTQSKIFNKKLVFY